MSGIGVIIIPVGFILAGIFAYFIVKNNWEIGDFF